MEYASYASLVIGFIVLAALLLLPWIGRRTWWKTAVLIPCAIWFGLVLLYTPGHLAGWPTHSQTPEELALLGVHVVEPSKDCKGAIYVWGLQWSKEVSERMPIDPREALIKFTAKTTPRCYQLPYSKDTHKKYERAKKESGIMILRRGAIQGKEGNSNVSDDANLEFKILNPQEVMEKP